MITINLNKLYPLSLTMEQQEEVDKITKKMLLNMVQPKKTTLPITKRDIEGFIKIIEDVEMKGLSIWEIEQKLFGKYDEEKTIGDIPDISVRAYNLLSYHRVKTIKDLLNFDLSKHYRGMGQSTKNEIIEMIAKYKRYGIY